MALSLCRLRMSNESYRRFLASHYRLVALALAYCRAPYFSLPTGFEEQAGFLPKALVRYIFCLTLFTTMLSRL